MELNHPIAGQYKQIGSALRSPTRLTDPKRRPAPSLGEHTREILSGLGYKDEEIDQLIVAGVVRNP